jgi:FMN-dependent oxidoreductase (nitrilotriacetate monooxygenase family)
MSGGRSGWNVVTSANASEAYNFGRDEHYGHSDRYDRAEEFVEVAKGLWDTWDDDAMVRERKSALYFDPAKVHFLNHKGKHFSVRGPLNVTRPPQGYPVIVQASASETGKDLAAKVAEVIFTPLHEFEQGRQFYKDLKTRAEKFGRSWDDMIIMPGLNVIVASTEKQAKEKVEHLNSLIHPDVGKELLSNALGGIDLSDVDVDKPLPDGIISVEDRRSHPRYSFLFKEPLTVKQMYQKYGAARGQRTVTGTPSQIADQMEAWFRNRAVDGFLIQPAVLPEGLDDFITMVIPELQTRGIFRSEYEGKTLRENLGLRRPESRYSHRQ